MRSLTRVLLFLSLATTAAVSAAPVLTFEERAVVAQVTKGASTAWLAVVSEPSAYTPRTSEYARIIEDSDNDGIVRFELDAPKPVAVWMVVDMTNGQHAIGAPAGVILNRTTLRPSAVRSRGNNTHSGLVFASEALTLCWVVRPGAGAWRMIAEDGDDEDTDGRPDGSVTSELRRFRAVGTSAGPPEDFAAGDIIVTISLDGLAVSELRVNQGHQ